MFKYGLILLLTIILFSCGETEDIRWEDENENIVDCDKVIGYTDSLIIFADKKIDKIRKRNKNQILVMDSLEHTIEVEQHIIDNLNKEVVRRIGVDETLELTIIKLEKSLLRCKSKEKKNRTY